MTSQPQAPGGIAQLAPAPSPPGRWKRRAAAGTAAACWAYAAVLLAVWLTIVACADRCWVGTVAMFSPRWMWSLPLALLLPLGLIFRRRPAWLALATSILILLGPVMHLCVPWRRALPARGGEPALRLRIVTLNADESYFDADAFARWLEQVRPDVVALQACRARDRRKVFGPSDDADGWHGRKDGELVVQSRFPVEAARVTDERQFSAGEGGTLASYDLRTPAGTVRLFDLHLATPRYALLAVARGGAGGADVVRSNSRRRLAQSEAARRWVDEALGAGVPVIVAGDFNTPVDSATYRRFWSGLTNAFSVAGFGFGSTHFTKHTAVRIDHVLAGPGWRCRRAWVGPFVGSAHRPVVADVELAPRATSSS